LLNPANRGDYIYIYIYILDSAYKFRVLKLCKFYFK